MADQLQETHSQLAATLTSRVTRLESQITGYELKVQELVSKYVQAETRIQQVEISKQPAAAATTGLPGALQYIQCVLFVNLCCFL
jgi:phage shock protein A